MVGRPAAKSVPLRTVQVKNRSHQIKRMEDHEDYKAVIQDRLPDQTLT
jgi:hypothetical protein